MSELLFENYELFLKEHVEEFSTPQNAIKSIADEGCFRSYVDALTEGLSPDVRASVLGILNRQREELLTEAANVPGSAFAYGWTVLSFPVLVDIYAEPIIAELCNLYTTDSPIVSVPRISIEAQVKSYDGSTTTTYTLPTSTQLVRADVVNVNVSPNTITNLFTAASLSSDNLKMNRRYTMITKVVVDDYDGTNHNTIEVDLTIRPDNRSQFVKTFTFTDSASAQTQGYLTGHVNYETGETTYQVVFSGGTAGHTYTADHAVYTLRFAPYNTMNGRVKVNIKTEMTDLTIDENDDFVIELTQEDMQDYKAIFKIDLIRTLSEAIKRQILLNKDQDLAYFLNAAEADIAANGAKSTVDLTDYSQGAGEYAPANILDVLKAVVPRISTIAGVIKKNFQMYPTYVVSGLKTASLLRSLQEFMVNLPNNKGALGFTGATAQFMKMKVLESNAIADNKIYLSTKAPQNALEKSAIIDFVYKPLYLINETTDGLTRNFVKSRTMIEIARTDGLGLVQVDNIDNYIG